MGKKRAPRLEEALAWLVVCVTLLKVVATHLLPLLRSLQEFDWTELRSLAGPDKSPATPEPSVVVDVAPVEVDPRLDPPVTPPEPPPVQAEAK